MESSDSFRTLTLGPTNLYFLKAGKGYLQIDTSLPQYYKAFLEGLKRINVDLEQISYLLLSHSHDDHAGFAAELRERTHCKIIAHMNSLESLKEGTIINVGKFLNRQAAISMKLYNFSKRRSFEYAPVILGAEDIVISEDNENVLKQIGVDGKIIYTPGHTDDGISVVLSDGDAFVSDVCMSNLGFLHYRPIEVSNLDQVFKSWRKIIDSGAKTIYPAHGKAFPVKELEHYLAVYSSPTVKARAIDGQELGAQ